ncbi:hypothetical protein C0J52_23651, partial [Blattella germanica]
MEEHGHHFSNRIKEIVAAFPFRFCDLYATEQNMPLINNEDHSNNVTILSTSTANDNNGNSNSLITTNAITSQDQTKLFTLYGKRFKSLAIHVSKAHGEAYRKQLSHKYECPLENTKDTDTDSPSSINPITVADVSSPATQQILQFEKALEE